tara:strand:- start:897 stop:1157 length:261 start_codon:yes stop_codon:yes gene_type:complete
MEYTWVKKKLKADYFGMVSGLNCVLQGVDGDKTETANFVLVIPEHAEEHADAWTEERINAIAESGRENLEIEIVRKMNTDEEVNAQ